MLRRIFFPERVLIFSAVSIKSGNKFFTSKVLLPGKSSNLISNNVFNTDKIKSSLDWKPTYSNEKMLIESYDNYLKNYLNKKDIFLSVDSHHNQNNWPLNNFILLTNKLLETKCNIYINFSKNNLNYLRVFKKHFGNDCRIKYTYQKSICEIISIIEKSTYIIGNESGPVCIGATLKKKVHSIYLPIYTKPESKIISNKIFYYNSNLICKEIIIKKILDSIKKN
jgi:ADP-heptose:LPS heptosyltransferase